MTCVLIAFGLAGCSDDPTVPVRMALSPTATMARATRLVDAVCPPGATCLTPTELSVKIGAAYLAEDIASGAGDNVGLTQAVYASPECDGIEGGSEGNAVQPQPNLGSCSIDVGLQSSSRPPQTITKSPRYIDLAAGKAAVTAALDAGKFGVAPATYKYLRLDIGSNAPTAQFNGNQVISPPGTAMNFRFKVEGMAEPFEIRRLVGVDVAFPSPVTLTLDQQVDVVIDYSVVNVVQEFGAGNGTPPEEAACTPPAGSPAKRYCLNVSAIQFAPSLVIVPPGA